MKVTLLCTAALAAAFAATMGFAQQDHTQHQTTSPQHSMPMMDVEKCKKDMKEGEDRLAKLVAKMDAAKGAAKTEAVANTVKEMIAQEKAMHKMCMSMMESMHGGMKMDTGAQHKHGG